MKYIMRMTAWTPAILLVAALSCVVVVGCIRRAAAPPPAAIAGAGKALHDLGGGDYVASLIAEATQPYFTAGLGLMFLGGAAFILGMRYSGGCIIALGLIIKATGEATLRYPWIYLIVMVALAGFLIVLAYDRLRARKVLEATAEVIQNAPEGAAIKAGLAGMGEKVEGLVREIITPIKKKLRREKKIEAK